MSIRHARKSPRATLLRAAAGFALAGGLTAGTMLPAQAAVPTAAGATAISVADQHVGTPYRYGGTTPAGFDCSGYTSYVFAHAGVSLPRTATDQMRASQRISAAEARPGDLVFFTSGARAYHVGVYAGDGQMYDAGRSGSTVTKRPIWTSAVVYGRVLH